jgi:hypothetical protein
LKKKILLVKALVLINVCENFISNELQMLLVQGYYKRVGLFCKAKDRHEFHGLTLMKKYLNAENAKKRKKHF